MKYIFYHGTSEENAKKIMQEGFKLGQKANWKVKSKDGFVYFSSAYAPFYAMKHSTRKLALIKVEIDSIDLYPEDDWLMRALGKPVYSQKSLMLLISGNIKSIGFKAMHRWAMFQQSQTRLRFSE